MSLPFQISGPAGARVVRVQQPLFDGPKLGRLVLRSSADRPLRLEPSEWPELLAESVDRRLAVRQGQAKGRVLTIWREVLGERAQPVAVCCWHVHDGCWPLAILDAGVANVVAPEVAKQLRAILVAAIAELAGHERFADRQAPRPTDRVLWRVDHVPPGPKYAARRARARAAASRGQADFGARKIPRKDRPAWAKDGFLGRIDVDSS